MPVGVYERKPLLERFWSKVDKTGIITDCWVWIGALQRGYGRFGYKNKIVMAHRFSYEILKGKIPKDLDLDHICRNRACVNPNHLEPVTRKENLTRGLVGKINNRQKEKTHCPKGHAYIGENLYKAPNGGRFCKICVKSNTNKFKYGLEIVSEDEK